jgi:hypothetical protein
MRRSAGESVLVRGGRRAVCDPGEWREWTPVSFALVRGATAIAKLTMIIKANFAIVVWARASEKLTV